MKKSYSVRTILLVGSLLLQLSTVCFHARGAAGDVDLSFDPGSRVNDAVSALALQPDGKLLIVGRGIARLNTDGSVDSNFNGEFTAAAYVKSVALQQCAFGCGRMCRSVVT